MTVFDYCKVQYFDEDEIKANHNLTLLFDTVILFISKNF